MKLGPRIKQARESAGLNQTELAKRLGITRSAVSQWEADKGTGPKRENLEQIAEILGVSYEWLATGKHRAGEPVSLYSDLPEDQRELLELYKKLSPRRRKALLEFLRLET